MGPLVSPRVGVISPRSDRSDRDIQTRFIEGTEDKHEGFPGGSDGKESACHVGDLALIPGLGWFPGGGHGNPLQYSCLENPHGRRTLVGYSPWGHKESDTTEWLSTADNPEPENYTQWSHQPFMLFCSTRSQHSLGHLLMFWQVFTSQGGLAWEDKWGAEIQSILSLLNCVSWCGTACAGRKGCLWFFKSCCLG